MQSSGDGRLNASAFVVGSSDGPGAMLQDLAASLGFSPVQSYAGLRRAEKQAEATPLQFFLCAEVPDVRSLKPMADAIRFSPSLNLRFAPLIYFARQLSVDAIRLCIGMGFDDVIALPYAGGDLGERIGRQVGTRQVYYDTGTYFGPDRRNRDEASRPDARGGASAEFRRIEIIRTPESGVDVLSDDAQFLI